METTLAIPVDALDTVTHRLDCCSRHGLPAVKRIDFALQSRPRLESNRALSGNVAATAGRLAEHAGKVRVTRVRNWPFCARCVRTRRSWMVVAALCFWGGLALLLGSVVARLANGPSPALGIPMFSGIALVIVSPWPFVLGSIPRLIGARTAPDGNTVQVQSPAPEFAAQAGNA